VVEEVGHVVGCPVLWLDLLQTNAGDFGPEMIKLIAITCIACLCLAGCVIVFDLDRPQPEKPKAIERPVPDGIDWDEYERARDAGELDAHFVVEMEARKTWLQSGCNRSK
jgi:hypothetical protein